MSRPTVKELENWYDDIIDDCSSFKEGAFSLANWAIDRALAGMIPADDPLVLDAREVKWPEGSIAITGAYIFDYEHKHYGQVPLFIIHRPKPEWRPKPGQDVWVKWGNGDLPQLLRWEYFKLGKDTVFIAAAYNVSERHWTEEQFKARGEYWRIAK